MADMAKQAGQSEDSKAGGADVEARGDAGKESDPLLGGKGSETNFQVLEVEKSKPKLICGLKPALFSGSFYCLASASMIMLNKMALSSFNFKSANALLFFQCTLCVVLVRTCSLLGFIKVEPFKASIVKIWLPVNMIFVCMIATSFWALKNLNVAMVTVLKNLTNLFVVGGDYLFYGRQYTGAVYVCMGFMLLSAVVGGITDLTFNFWGYFWNMVNCGFTASYSLYLRGAMDRVVPHTSTGKKLDEFSMVFYNNVLSLPFIFVLMLVTGDLFSVWSEPDLTNPRFMLVAFMSGVIGFSISFASLWFLSTTTPTVYSLIGSLNKIPLAVVGLFAFNIPWSLPNLASIALGLVAGVAFAFVKSKA